MKDSMICEQEARFKVKELQKLFNKEGQSALKDHYQRELTKARTILDRLIKNGSGRVPMRTPWARLPIKPWEV